MRALPGAGFEKIEMQFLSDVFVRCPDCDGRRYRAQILEVKIGEAGGIGPLSIAGLLDSTVDEAIEFFAKMPASRNAAEARDRLQLLQEAGLGYLSVGQPINTLSGGESQRMKLVRFLADAGEARRPPKPSHRNTPQPPAGKPVLFIFDEPTTGLHFADIKVLLKMFQRLVDAGHSLLVIEHNLEVIKTADWVLDLGPEAGDGGGRLVVEGTPETVAACAQSHTGRALREVLKHAVRGSARGSKANGKLPNNR